MWRMSVLLLATCVAAGVPGCGDLEDHPGGAPGAPPSPAPPPPAPAPAPSGGSRSLGDAQRAAMKDVLVAETGKTVWIFSAPANPEVATLVESLSAVFRDAGWTVAAETASGIALKPGIMTLIGDEQYPPYVDTVLKALDAGGLDAKSASGYRGYHQEKKRENASWPGIPMRPDQDFVVVIGPKPAG